MLTDRLPIRRGRPRDPAADRAILEAARTVLARKGFTGTSMEGIARTAGVGKDTLYRRWSSKEDLIRHLLTVLSEENVPVPAELDDPRYALFVFLQDIVRLNRQSDFGAIVAGLVGESARNPELAAAFHRFWNERRDVTAGIVRRIVDPATPEAEIERFVDRTVGPIYYRILLSCEPITDEYLWDLVTTIPWPAEDLETPDNYLQPTREG
jgi:AcrR family transcriptional regulator